jgi:hypothetical protein
MPAAENNNKFWNLARKTAGLSLDIQGSRPSQAAHLIALGRRIEVRATSSCNNRSSRGPSVDLSSILFMSTRWRRRSIVLMGLPFRLFPERLL